MAKEINLTAYLPPAWYECLATVCQQPFFRDLEAFLAVEHSVHSIFPPLPLVFSALHYCRPEDISVVILGQDPYHDEGQAHGLAFSVPHGMPVPPSLRNILMELENDLGTHSPSHGNLESWAEQGVLLLNTVLTVRAHQANSHRNRGWETFTDAVISIVNGNTRGAVFLLWGKPAQAKADLIDEERHMILTAPHPSPLSAYRGFFGSRPFSSANEALRCLGRREIDWSRAE